MDKAFITIGGISLIVWIYWFFFGKKEDAVAAGNAITIIVDGGYKPSHIKIKKDKTTTLTFLRKDPNSCLEEIVIPDFKIKKFLPLNEPISVTLSPPQAGTYGIHCGMNMFHGKIIVI